MDEPFSVLLGSGGPIVSRLTGSIPRRLDEHERRRLRDALALGHTIEVVTASAESWRAMRRSLYNQLGVRPA